MSQIENIRSYTWFSDLTTQIGFTAQLTNTSSQQQLVVRDLVSHAEEQIETNWRDYKDFPALSAKLEEIKNKQDKINAQVQSLQQRYANVTTKMDEVASKIGVLQDLLALLLNGTLTQEEFQKKEQEFLQCSKDILDNFSKVHEELTNIKDQEIGDEHKQTTTEDAPTEDREPSAYEKIMAQYNEMMEHYQRVMDEYKKFEGEYSKLDSVNRNKKLKAYNSMLSQYNTLLATYNKNLKAYQAGRLDEEYQSLNSELFREEYDSNSSTDATEEQIDKESSSEESASEDSSSQESTSQDKKDTNNWKDELQEKFQEEYAEIKEQMSNTVEKGREIAEECSTTIGQILDEGKAKYEAISIESSFSKMIKTMQETSSKKSHKAYNAISEKMAQLKGWLTQQGERLHDASFRKTITAQNTCQEAKSYKKWYSYKDDIECGCAIMFSILDITFVDISACRDFSPQDLLEECRTIEIEITAIQERFSPNWEKEQENQVSKAKILCDNMYLRASQLIHTLKECLLTDPQIQTAQEKWNKVYETSDIEPKFKNILSSDFSTYSGSISSIPAVKNLKGLQKVAGTRLVSIQEHRSRILNRIDLTTLIQCAQSIQSMKSGVFTESKEFKEYQNSMSRIKKVLPTLARVHGQAFSSLKTERSNIVKRAVNPLMINQKLVLDAQRLQEDCTAFSNLLAEGVQQANTIQELRNSINESMQNIKKTLSKRKYHTGLLKSFMHTIQENLKIENPQLLRNIYRQIQEIESLILKDKPFQLLLDSPSMKQEESIEELLQELEHIQNLLNNEGLDTSAIDQCKTVAIQNQDTELLYQAIHMAEKMQGAIL